MRMYNIQRYVLILLLFIPMTIQAEGTFKTIVENGPLYKRINIVFLGDGYTVAQESKFDTDVFNMMTYMLTVPPFDGYQSYYNADSIYVPSVDSGSDHPPESIFKDTYFNGTFDSYGIQRLTTIPPNDYDGNWNNGYGKVIALLTEHLPEYDMIVLLFNDPVYGGSGGSISISSIHESAPEIVVHEVGHSFGRLADEYDYGKNNSGRVEQPNVTQQTILENIPWNIWIEEGTPIPTPENSGYANVVGLFEGANYEPTGWYRPRLNCKMKALGYEFCEICAENIILEEYLWLSPIENHWPASPVLVDSLGSQFLEIFPMKPSYYDMEFQWYINDSLIESEISSSFLIDGSIGLSAFDVKAIVIDTTSYVRNDPTGRLIDSVIWSVEMANCCLGIRGNANGIGEVNVADLTYLVDYLFKGGIAPSCVDEANVDGLSPSGVPVDVADLVYLVDYIFKGGPAPIPC